MWRHTAFFTITLLIASAELPPSMAVFGAPPQTATEHLQFEIERGWKIGSEAGPPSYPGSLTEFIREGDDINNWKELLTITFFLGSGGPTPEDTLNNMKAFQERACPGVTKWSIIAKDTNSILYEWQAKPCRGWPDQDEIARIIYGKYIQSVIRHTVKVYQMSPEERSKWIARFLQAKIITTSPQR